MTKLEQAARQALEALELRADRSATVSHKIGAEIKAITALREALDPELQFVRDWNEGKVRRVSDGKIMGVAEQAEQEPVSKALLLATDALVYHTEQTRPIQKTDEAIIYLRNVMAQGVSSMAFTLEDAMAKYPEISYWHNEFLKHNTTAEQAEQEPVAWKDLTYGNLHHQDFGNSTPLYAAPVRTKDLTDDEIADIRMSIVAYEPVEWGRVFARAVIAKLREKERQK